MGRNKKDSVKIQSTFTKKQFDLIRKYKGILGEDDGEIVRYIVINWLLEKSKVKEDKKNE